MTRLTVSIARSAAGPALHARRDDLAQRFPDAPDAGERSIALRARFAERLDGRLDRLRAGGRGLATNRWAWAVEVNESTLTPFSVSMVSMNSRRGVDADGVVRRDEICHSVTTFIPLDRFTRKSLLSG